MCDCGCNTCETKGPLLTEGKVKSLLSEGLQYHIDKKIPLFETVYRIGSDKHLSLIKEARKMYSRNIIDLCEEDEALIKTHLGEFALYEGESVPLDLPMLEEEVNNSDLDNAIYRLENVYKYLDTEYKETRRGEKFIQINYIPVTSPQSQNPEFVNVRYNNDEDIEMIKNRLGLSMLNETNKISDDKLMRLIPKMPKDYVGKNAGIGKYTISTPDGEDIVLTQSKDKKNWFYEPSNVALKILNESYDYDEVAQSEFGMDYDQLGSGEKEWVRDEIDNMSMNEAKKEIDEAEFKGKKVALGKPKRGGPKAYYVYVKDGDKVKKVTFGSGGLRAKIKNKEARNAFAARHNCKDKKDRTKAGYWSCNLPRYAPALGLGAKMNTFW